MPSKLATRGIKIKHLMMAVAVVAVCIGVVRPALLVVDALGHGPYSRWYNFRCQRLASQASLIGKPEGEIKQVLGEPDSIWDYEQPGGRTRTYNYAPSLAASGKFQVHCRGGLVVSLEQLDD